MAPTIICIDGIPGAGKTTLLDRLSHRYPCFPEPEWQLMDIFYKNPSKYAFPFHVEILISKFKQSLEFPESGIVLVERCPWSTMNVFAPLLLTEYELNTFNDVYERLKYEVNHFIYLETQPKVALERIHERSLSDATITLDYLAQLDEKYYKSFESDEMSVCFTNANKSIDSVESDVIFKIEKFLEKNKMN